MNEDPEIVVHEEDSEAVVQNIAKALEVGKTDPEKSFLLLKELAEHGSPGAMFHLAHRYNGGVGTARDTAEAEKWYLRAASAAKSTANDRARALASFYLGYLYFGRSDYEKAREAWMQGADLNYPPSIFSLAYMYRKGVGVKKSARRARELYERASILGYVSATCRLSVMLMSGRFGIANIFKGIRLYFKGTKEYKAFLAINPKFHTLDDCAAYEFTAKHREELARSK